MLDNITTYQNEKQKGNYYIIADHLRTTIFALGDGALIESKGRGYILRKLIKRSCLTAFFLNLSTADLLAISQKIIEINGTFYTHLQEKKIQIMTNLEKEIVKEMNFITSATKKIANYCSKNFQKIIPTHEIFLWYDTHGIPLELISYYLEEKGKDFFEAEFNQLLAEQKLRGKEDRKSKKINIFSKKQ